MALSINVKSDLTVITSAGNIIKACDFLGVNYISHKPFSTLEIIKNRPTIKNEISSLVRVIGQNELHFSHTQFAVFCFLLVKNLKQINDAIIFHDFEMIYKKPKSFQVTSKLIKKRIQALLISIIYLIPIEVRVAGDSIFVLSLNTAFIKKSFILRENKSKYFETTLEMFKSIKVKHHSIENLFIAQTFTNEQLFSLDKVNSVIPFLNSSNFSVKMHPKLGKVKGLEKCSILPEFLSVELFFSKVTKFVVSFHSASLITASKFENITAISLLDIVKKENTFNEEIKKEMLEKSHNKILFPKDIKELKSILSGQE